jgi:hypothetical protein
MVVVSEPLLTVFWRCGRNRQSALDREQRANYVLLMFKGERHMIRAFVEEAATLASLALFLGMIAIWAQVIGTV